MLNEKARIGTWQPKVRTGKPKKQISKYYQQKPIPPKLPLKENAFSYYGGEK